MIPLHLKLAGFLSYRDPVEIDFNGFDLACISGSNGAGKSSLLDAMTWALFGQARKRDETLINLQSSQAEVVFTFQYEANIYRVLRSLPRGKTTMLEFQIAEVAEEISPADGAYSLPETEVTWRPLTERTMRDTQARIQQILRLDYDTFINVSFFLQGKADQFAQQPPSRRKEILSNILGLEIWETYRERSAERRKGVERELDSVKGRVVEIDSELDEETPRKEHLADLEEQLKILSENRKSAEAALENIKQVHDTLEQQRQMARNLGDALARSREAVNGMQQRLELKSGERDTHAALVTRAEEIETGYASLQKARLDLEKWEQVAGRFREYDQRRQPLLREIESSQARLEQEAAGLQKQQAAMGDSVKTIANLETELSEAKQILAQAEGRLSENTSLEQQIQQGREKWAELRSENTSLKNRMNDTHQRMVDLETAEGAVCPLCGQALSPEHRQSTIEQLKKEILQFTERETANRTAMETLERQAAVAKQILSQNASADTNRMNASTRIAQVNERLETLKKQSAEWDESGAKRLEIVQKLLDQQDFASEARLKLDDVDRELSELGYDSSGHDAARKHELQARKWDDEYRNLESARAALKPLDDEIVNLNKEIETRKTELATQEEEYAEVKTALETNEAQAPDMDAADRILIDLRERENMLNQEVGAARQKVDVLKTLRKHKKELEAERGALGLQIGQFKELERAFGKDGIPALLIEQALPEIELKANQILGRLSDDTMRLHFETQAAYKDAKRKDLRETLEIQVSDGAGMRDYEMYSGGEAFRVNFSIRLALSEVLAQRKGARLQMLVIDEGFGSQDSLGRQRLIQAINAVRHDFAKILVITHLEELKDAFPTRIEVEKTERGSTLAVV